VSVRCNAIRQIDKLQIFMRRLFLVSLVFHGDVKAFPGPSCRGALFVFTIRMSSEFAGRDEANPRVGEMTVAIDRVAAAGVSTHAIGAAQFAATMLRSERAASS